MRLGHVILYVPNVPAALEFWEKAFGLTRRFVHPSGMYGELETGATALAFAAEAFVAMNGIKARPSRPSEDPAGAEVALVADDVQAAYDTAVAAGATALRPPALMMWGQTVAHVRDLNGFLVEICSPMG